MAPLSFDEMVTGERGVGNRFVKCFRFKPDEVLDLAEKLHLPAIILHHKKPPTDRDLALLVLPAPLVGPQRQAGQMEHLFQRDHRDTRECGWRGSYGTPILGCMHHLTLHYPLTLYF